MATARGTLTFTSVTTVNHENQRLVVSENHRLASDSGDASSDYQFVMRCWTRSELASRLARSGFAMTAYFGAYDPAVAAGRTDRLVAVTQLPMTKP